MLWAAVVFGLILVAFLAGTVVGGVKGGAAHVLQLFKYATAIIIVLIGSVTIVSILNIFYD